jgi:molecular chaperone GrpE
MSETVEIESTPVADQLGRLQAEAADWQDKYLRLYAELDNRKKRIGLRYVNQYEEEKEELLRDMLPLADNLERALANTSGDVTEAGLRRGVDITLEAFLNTLAKYGVKPIQAIGQPFDPNLHEAVGAIQKPDLPPGIVVRVLTKGYMIRDKLLRPAGVLITKE